MNALSRPAAGVAVACRPSRQLLLFARQTNSAHFCLLLGTTKPFAKQFSATNRIFLTSSSTRGFSSTLGSQLEYDKKNDFYTQLGVKVDADPKQIKLAYYRLAQKYHPDKAGDSEKVLEKFKTITGAYEVLVDGDLRKKYDRLRTESQNGGAKSAYSSRKSGGGGGQSASSGKRSDKQDDFFYGKHRDKEDFYDYYSNFTQGKNQKNTGDSKQRKYNDKEGENFYKTNQHKQSARDKWRRESEKKWENDDPFDGKTFDGKTAGNGDSRGFRASDHYDKWGGDQFTKDGSGSTEGGPSSNQYYEWAEKQTKGGRYQNSNFNTFKRERHRTQTDGERRAEREAKYGRYKPDEGSAFHRENREFTHRHVRSTWDAFMNASKIFQINRDNRTKEFHGEDSRLNESFENAKKWFDSQQHESMTRKPLNNDEVKKMLDPKKVIFACLLISGVKKTVDRLVR